MATYYENLVIRRDKIAAELAVLESKPDYSIDGESISWASMRASLVEELKSLTELILQAAGPTVVYTRGR